MIPMNNALSNFVSLLHIVIPVTCYLTFKVGKVKAIYYRQARIEGAGPTRHASHAPNGPSASPTEM